MKQCILWLILCLTVFVMPSMAFSESRDFPSLSAEAGHVFISNRTNGEVVFFLESANTPRAEHHLAPNSAATFRGASGDSWFNISVYSKGSNVTYGLDAGTRHYLEWNSSGILDVFKMPAR